MEKQKTVNIHKYKQIIYTNVNGFQFLCFINSNNCKKKIQRCIRLEKKVDRFNK